MRLARRPGPSSPTSCPLITTKAQEAMRTNLPVTAVEYPIDDDTLIVSKTDTKGKLTYFNEQFVAASGFTDQELMGQPHNIIRHPDMPPEAFADLWATLKAGKPWAGAVKNRRKNGDFYWVLASATPIWEGGQVAGYMSIRSKLPADQRAEAEHVYALLRTGKAGAYRVAAGMIRRNTFADRLHVFTGSLKARLVTLTASMSALLLLVGLTGILSAEHISRQAKTIYEDRTVPLEQLFEINDRMKENALLLTNASIHGSAGKPADDTAARVSENVAAISKVWAEYMATYLTPEEKVAAQAFIARRADYVEGGLKPALSLLAQAKYGELAGHLAGKTNQLFTLSKIEMDKLVAIQVKEAKAAFNSAETVHSFAIVAGVSILLLGLALGGMLGRAAIRAIGRPMGHLNDVMSGIAQGSFNSRVIVERDDEIGVALRNLQALQSKLGFDREEKKDVERRIAEQRKLDMYRIASEFEAAVGDIVKTVATASTELEASASSLTHTADATQRLSIAVASASEEASAGVQSVASATEEMSSSIGEIGRQIEISTRVSASAVQQARLTDERIAKLTQAAAKIGDIVELITNIAGQTNLLALNATIEAARAGEAGRGFAVVASEVKALAAQTAKATSEISSQIAEIQSATANSVADIKEIGATIGNISEITTTIAAAVEEQSAATQEIARNVQQAAHGTSQTASNITEVNRGASETGTASSQVLTAAQSLSVESNRLMSEVDKFLATVRAA